MRWIMMLAAALVLPGCTNRQLQTSTARQAQTVVDLEYKQILDNLAMFSLNRDAMPSMAMLKTGATQVGDTGQIGFVGTAGLGTRFGSSPTFSGTRTIVDQWGSSPMTDDNNLMLVRKAFRCALGYKDLLGEDDANDLAHDLSAQIGTTSDISVDQDTLGRVIGQSVAAAVAAEHRKQQASHNSSTPSNPSNGITQAEKEKKPEGDQVDSSRAQEKFLTNLKDQLKAEQARRDLQRERLSKTSQLLADAREIIGTDLTDTLDQEVLAKTYSLNFNHRIELFLVRDVVDMDKLANQNKPFDFPIDQIVLLLDKTDGDKIFKFNDKHEITDSIKTNSKLVLFEDSANNQIQFFLYDSKGNKLAAQDIPSSNYGYVTLKKTLRESFPGEKLSSDQSREILVTLVEAVGLQSLLKVRFEPTKDSATGLAKEAIYRVNDAQKNLDEINPGWFRCGPKVPKDACYSGHAKFCGQECYVWVCRDGLNDLEEFTRKVLKLGTTLKDVQVVTAPSGIQFAPALTNPGR